MSKTSFVVGIAIAGGVGASFLGAFKTVDQRLESLASHEEKVNGKLKAAGDVVTYGGAVERLTAPEDRRAGPALTGQPKRRMSLWTMYGQRRET